MEITEDPAKDNILQTQLKPKKRRGRPKGAKNKKPKVEGQEKDLISRDEQPDDDKNIESAPNNVNDEVKEIPVDQMRFELRKLCIQAPQIVGNLDEKSVEGLSDERVQQEFELARMRASSALNENLTRKGLNVLGNVVGGVLGCADELCEELEQNEQLRILAQNTLTIELFQYLPDAAKFGILLTDDVIKAYKTRSDKDPRSQSSELVTIEDNKEDKEQEEARKPGELSEEYLN